MNHTDNSQGVQRILNSHPVEAVIGESSSSAAVSGASNFTTLVILISLIVVACIAAAIISAIFIMKRRFSSWRINSSKAGAETNEDAENGDAKCTEVNEKEATVETTNEQTPAETVEAKQDAVVSGETPAVAEVVEKSQELTTQVVVEQVEQPQASPSSESPLIEEQSQAQTVVVAEQNTVVAIETGVEPAVVVNANTQSSTSLIANVLSELSESVASKLQTDPEKQPLNQE